MNRFITPSSLVESELRHFPLFGCESPENIIPPKFVLSLNCKFDIKGNEKGSGGAAVGSKFAESVKDSFLDSGVGVFSHKEIFQCVDVVVP